MKLLDLTYPTPAENLACDEALLEALESGDGPETLRFWEPDSWFVALGYANRAAREVDLDACREQNVPVLRRVSGGGTVLQGPGSLNYSVVLSIAEDGPLATVTGANDLVIERNRAALDSLTEADISADGQTDLTIGPRKFSGNAQRRKRRSMLFHGTLLLDFDIARVSELLPMPSKEPEYRGSRSHTDFLTNLHLDAADVKRVLAEAWAAGEPYSNPPDAQIAHLVAEKYSRDDWNLKF